MNMAREEKRREAHDFSSTQLVLDNFPQRAFKNVFAQINPSHFRRVMASTFDLRYKGIQGIFYLGSIPGIEDITQKKKLTRGNVLLGTKLCR